MLQLVIGNTNYSSWSMRPWVAMRQAGIEFEEIQLRFDSFAEGSHFQRDVARYSAAGRVPGLMIDGYAVWDTLAIAETLAERFPERTLWPRDALQRARARSLCAEMHAGFAALRNACPMNIEAAFPEVGQRVLAEQDTVQRDLARIDAMWSEALAASGGPFLFGAFGIVDAFYAPVVARTRTYGLPLSEAARAYGERIWATPAVTAWVAGALAEHDFVAADEPYRSTR